jgi:hypothetical protein
MRRLPVEAKAWRSGGKGMRETSCLRLDEAEALAKLSGDAGQRNYPIPEVSILRRVFLQ